MLVALFSNQNFVLVALLLHVLLNLLLTLLLFLTFTLSHFDILKTSLCIRGESDITSDNLQVISAKIRFDYDFKTTKRNPERFLWVLVVERSGGGNGMSSTRCVADRRVMCSCSWECMMKKQDQKFR